MPIKASTRKLDHIVRTTIVNASRKSEKFDSKYQYWNEFVPKGAIDEHERRDCSTQVRWSIFVTDIDTDDVKWS